MKNVMHKRMSSMKAGSRVAETMSKWNVGSEKPWSLMSEGNIKGTMLVTLGTTNDVNLDSMT
jgi:hypothetical protein